MLESFAVGIDVGTSAVKATVLSSAGRVAAFTSSHYPTHSPRDGWSEQDPDDWWAAVGEVLEQVVAAFPGLSARTTVLGLTGQMHTTVLRDASGRQLREAILWSDNRADEQSRRLVAAEPEWSGRTGHRPIPAFTSAHLRWLADHEPRTLAQVARVTVPKDDIRWRLGAGFTTDPSDASAMNLMSDATDDWDDDLLHLVGIRRGQLAPVVPSASFAGCLRALPPMSAVGERYAGRLLGMRIIAGAGDQAAQAVALGVVSSGRLGLSVGTSGVAFQASCSPRRGTFRHAIPSTWLALDSTHSAGRALEWWHRVSGMSYQDFPLPKFTADTPLPIFLPYLQGGRGEPGPPGTLTDLRSTHGPRDLAAAVLEGVCLEMIRLAQRVSHDEVPPGPVGIGGRAAQIETLLLLVAAGLNRPVSASTRGPSFGVAVLAGRAAGWFDAATISEETREIRPDPAIAFRLTQRLVRYEDVLKSAR